MAKTKKPKKRKTVFLPLPAYRAVMAAIQRGARALRDDCLVEMRRSIKNQDLGDAHAQQERADAFNLIAIDDGWWLDIDIAYDTAKRK